MVLRHLDLFSGIGGFSLGLEATGGFETVAFCDIEEFPRKVLQKHWPGVKQYEDIKKLNYEKIKADGLLPIDIITGGYPCQPFSVAGRKKGEKDPRHLWPEYFRLIKELRPTWVIGENVSGHIKLGLDTVLENLESEGYSVRTFSISAASIGANHQRERIWIVANSNSSGNKGKKSRSIGKENEKEKRDRQVNSTTRFPDGTDSIVTKQESESEVEHVENTRRSLRQGSEFRGENENEIRQGNANISERSSEASEFDVANTEGKYNSEQEGKIKSGGKIIEGRETEIWSESTGRSNTLANTESSQRNGNAINREHSETETQEELGVGSSISRTQGGSPWEGWWDIEPDVGRVAHGIPVRAHRLKGLGNSLVPTIPFYIGTIILEVMKDDG
jgi:DNA (cytosine-5)-methyltransferase 1